MEKVILSPPTNRNCSKCGEFQFRLLAEQMPDIVICMNADARFLYVNSRIEDLIGRKPDELIGKTCREAGLSEKCSSLLLGIARDTLQNLASLDREVPLEINGCIRILHIRTVRDMLPTGEPSVIATVRDITASRRTERQVQDLVQRLTYHMNNTPLAVMEWDPNGRCLIWNGEAEHIFGWTLREVKLGHIDWLNLVHPDEQEGFQVLLERLKRGLVASDFVRCRTLHRDGSVLYCECYLSALLDADGGPRSILWVANNVTDRVLAEQEMHQLNSGLADRVRKRTAELELSYNKLQSEIHARKELEAELISISEREHRRVGHDLHDGVCQEISGVRYSLEAISKKSRKGTVLREQMNKLTAALERAVHHIRLLSRGLAPLELEDGNLAAALEELAANTGALFQVKCVVRCRGRSARLELEKAINLFRIAQEAIQNAIKHGEADLITMDLDLVLGTLVIVDNGNGIKDDTPSPPRGNGMGLKIMRHRADAIKGSVSIEKITGGGVRVVCEFAK